MKKKIASSLGRRHMLVLGKRLFRLALHWAREGSPRTKKERDAAVAKIAGRKQCIHGSRRVDRARAAVDDAVVAILAARQARSRRQFPDRGRKSAARPARRRGNALTNSQMLSETLRERLRVRIHRQVECANPMRMGGAGGGSFRLKLVDEPSEVGYEVHIEKNWDTYRGQFKGWPAREDHHQVRVPSRWLRAVHRAGLAVVDGLLTLDVAPLDGAPQGVELYRAVWAGQGRGYSVNTERGYLALTRDRLGSVEYACHGRTIRGTLQGLKVKSDRQECGRLVPRIPLSKVLESVDPNGIDVRLSDAKAIGACEYGIRAWCHTVGLDPERKSAPLREVLDCYAKDPAPEARAAMLHAIRRQRPLPTNQDQVGGPGSGPPSVATPTREREKLEWKKEAVLTVVDATEGKTAGGNLPPDTLSGRDGLCMSSVSGSHRLTLGQGASAGQKQPFAGQDDQHR